MRASHCHSLKDKRAVFRKLRERVRSRYHLTIAEVGAQDNWQRLVIGFAVVGSDRVSVERTSADIAHFVERTGLAKLIRDDHELLAYGAEPIGDSEFSFGPDDHRDGDTGEDGPDENHDQGHGQSFADAEWIPASWKSEETP